MHFLHATLATPANLINAAKGIRAAKLALGQPVGMAQAAEIAQDIERNGITQIGQHADGHVVVTAGRVAKESSSGALLPHVDLTDKEYDDLVKAPLPSPPRRQPPRPTPSNNAYAVALQFMAMVNGNPLIAAAHARRMGVNADEPSFFEEVTQAIVGAFPWIEGRLDADEPLV